MYEFGVDYLDSRHSVQFVKESEDDGGVEVFEKDSDSNFKLNLNTKRWDKRNQK